LHAVSCNIIQHITQVKRGYSDQLPGWSVALAIGVLRTQLSSVKYLLCIPSLKAIQINRIHKIYVKQQTLQQTVIKN